MFAADLKDVAAASVLLQCLQVRDWTAKSIDRHVCSLLVGELRQERRLGIASSSWAEGFATLTTDCRSVPGLTELETLHCVNTLTAVDFALPL